MRLVTPGDCIELFGTARSLAVVGNAPTVKEHEHGPLIDGHDIVVRFNRIQTQGMEDKIGSRTDILCVNAANSLALAPSPATTTRPKLLVCFVSPQGCRQADFKAFGEWAGDLPILLTFGPDLIGLPPTAHGRPLTSGSYVLFSLLRLLEIERLFVTGFTMFGAVAGGSGKVYQDARPGVGAFHDIDQEAKIFTDILAEFRGELSVTPEIQTLLDRYGGRPSAAAICGSELPRENWRQWLARGLSWRLMGAALSLRRLGDAR